jgi:hypothetical protein
MYTYAYIIGILIIIPVWLMFFIRRADLRRAMIIIGIYVGSLAIFTDFIWFLKDYWYPLKYISTINLIWQDFFLGFFLGGAISVAQEFFLKKEVKAEKLNIKAAILLLLIILSPFFIFTTIFHITSIYSSIIGLILSLIIILINRKDLIVNSIISGLTSLIIAVIGYSIFRLIYPHIFNDWWVLKNISGVFILQIPLEELLWFMSFGMITGTLYKFLYTNKNHL